MHARGWRQRFFKILALRPDQFIFQPGSQKRQGIGILFIQLFRINFPESGEQILHDSRACLPFRPGIDRKRGRRRAFQPGGWIGQRIVKAQTVSGQRRREKIFRRLPEAPGVAVQKKVKEYGGKAEKKDGSKQTGEFLFQSNVLMRFLPVYEGKGVGMTGTEKAIRTDGEIWLSGKTDSPDWRQTAHIRIGQTGKSTPVFPCCSAKSCAG